MEIFTVLLVVVCFSNIDSSPMVRSRRGEMFECPADVSILPCKCEPSFNQKLICTDVKNYNVICQALDNKITGTAPYLKLKNIHASRLPSRAFCGLSFKRLFLEDSVLREVDTNAFEGLENALQLVVFRNNGITSFPSNALRKLRNLKGLVVDYNSLKKLEQDSLAGLNSLQSLDISDNKISQIERKSFPAKLTTLHLSRNRLRTLNGTVNDLNNLEWLILSGNKLRSVKDELRGLKNLKSLDLGNNFLHDISDSFDDLKDLRDLNLSGNKLRSVENAFNSLINLSSLYLSDNVIEELNANTFRRLKQLQKLDISGNPIRCTEDFYKVVEELHQRMVTIRGTSICPPTSQAEILGHINII